MKTGTEGAMRAYFSFIKVPFETAWSLRHADEQVVGGLEIVLFLCAIKVNKP